MNMGVPIKIMYNQEIHLGLCNDQLQIKQGMEVLAETQHGVELAKVLAEPAESTNEEEKRNMLKIIRIATEEDLEKVAENADQNQRALEICQSKIDKHKLPMKLVRAHHFFEGNKILFFFTSDGRVDFRNLVKDLASVFRTRIELRQIGVRDEAQLLGGYGVCGLQLCCTTSKAMTKPVSIKMAKEQNLALNSSKISGLCGRLLCCLAYEYETYRDLNKHFPRVGAKVWMGETKGVVRDISIQSRTVKIMLENHQYIEVQNTDIKVNKITGRKYIETAT